MRDFLNRFTLDALKLNAVTNTCAIILWLVVVGCAWFSVNRQPAFNRGQRLFWLLFITLVPFVGLLCYLPVCAYYATQDSTFLGQKK